MQAFQNGVECESAYLLDDIKEYSNNLKDVKKGTSIAVCNVFKIEDMSDLEVEVKKAFSLSDISDTQIINLQ